LDVTLIIRICGGPRRAANPHNSSELPTLFDKHVRLAWPAAHDDKSKTLFEVIKHLIYGMVYYINIFTNLSLLSVEMYLMSCEFRWLGILSLPVFFVLYKLVQLAQDATRKV